MMLCSKGYIPIFFFIVLVAFGTFISAQELPPLQVFSPQDYAAGDQNWSISQSEDKSIYVANNKGLLEFNGARWKLNETPNETILRSVEVIDNKIYTGTYMDFGYWERNKFGLLSYTSLVESSQLELIEDEEFWEIIGVEDWVLFQSFDRIYIYNNRDKSFKIINSDVRINKIYNVNGTVFFQKMNDGIYKIENGIETLLTQSADIKSNEVVNIFQNNGQLLIQTKEKGFFVFEDSELKEWSIEASELLKEVLVYNSTQLRDGSFVLGTISNGIIQLNSKGEIILRINQISGLSNNTVLSIFEDKTGNIWLGLDNGINTLNLDSPYKVYKDNLGVLGTIYASIKSDGYLYIGTNQGLFYRKDNSTSQFEFVEGTKGQVWNLSDVQGTVFCGHDKGTFVITAGNASLISDVKGTWVIKPIEGQNNLLLQGNYKGLNILEKKSNGDWIYRNKIKGFDISSRFIEFLSSTEVLVSHEYKGVYRITLDDDYTKIVDYKKEDISKGLYSSLVNYNGKILYMYSGGVFEYNKNENTFEKNSALSELFLNENYISGKLALDVKSNRLWGFSNDQIIYVEPGKLTNEPKLNMISLPSQIRKSKAGFENILKLKDENYFMGTKEGYLILNLNRLNDNTHRIQLNTVSNNSLHKTMTPLEIDNESNLANENNNIRFTYSVAEFNKFSPSSYQYRLEGIYNDWSPWSSKSEILFENLPPGDYVFEARAKINGNVSENTISYPFNIERPWYLSVWAIVFYCILFIGGGVLIQFLNRRYYKKQKQKLLEKKERELEIKELESQRKIMDFKNENLRQDIDNKNRELGMSTMNLIKRNELLNSIKKELSNTNKIGELKSVINLINKNLNTTDDWKLFEEAFNNTDKDFLKKVKKLHPSLTSNDLRLCTYLRLNLSSKEIAPLLNISPRSVEVKRYRLRKKMELSHESSLSNYIIDL